MQNAGEVKSSRGKGSPIGWGGRVCMGGLFFPTILLINE
jgi:hypothetical protein